MICTAFRPRFPGGADRIELCAGLDLGGLTPSIGQMTHAAAIGVPVHAMIRPRANCFVWSPDEIRVMETDVREVRKAGLAGVVLGANRCDGRLDGDVLEILCRQSEGLEKTLHRCFDVVPDPFEALEQAVELGFQRILTSGLARTAMEGAGMIAELMDRAGGRIIIMPGAGISAETIGRLGHLPLQEVHASCAVGHEQSGPCVDFGFSPRILRQSDTARVRALKRALLGLPVKPQLDAAGQDMVRRGVDVR